MALFRYTAVPASHAGLRFGPLRPRSPRALDSLGGPYLTLRRFGARANAVGIPETNPSCPAGGIVELRAFREMSSR